MVKYGRNLAESYGQDMGMSIQNFSLNFCFTKNKQSPLRNGRGFLHGAFNIPLYFFSLSFMAVRPATLAAPPAERAIMLRRLSRCFAASFPAMFTR